MNTNLQSAFVLLARPYRETSLLVDFLTESKGRVSAVARGARKSKSNWKAILQPFIALQINYSGQRELATLISVEQIPQDYHLKGRSLLCGFYLNEILQRVLHRHDPCLEIFTAYQMTLQRLQMGHEEITLRQFEKTLLNALGYGLQMTHDVENHSAIDRNKNYYFTPHHGCTEILDNSPVVLPYAVFSGEHLLAIANDQLDNRDVLNAAKRLMRLALQPLLGDKPLKSRELFMTQRI